ncbi:putative aldo/keto reductase [Acetobacter nitrogenifigens DSM 23921 = NBRC 105050]|uniref:Oxidoreductase n=1 Tax=Acetobacter nitrogenifigens DSM 23921 = NBRC 105050 TaxID=1120919 RepID=A0A511X6T1_9PROT|nr:aldo/keto reductase [Acetobacter nitrogenifigens]GBQ94946.1 putative aldo/keto reductase [Acetobacter nitrogenifigens DSM 23921 = NBRC 105050]GEN58656.1 oxidoreductase [Acetobacter nitrogenifigens DSM 23921 = NBRC 105050]
MQYTRLGNSGLKVSRLTLGCMSFGTGGFSGSWSLSEEDAQPIFRQALDLGITFWDTANVYGQGTSEEIVGRAIANLARRDDIVLATKLNFPMHDGPGGSGLSRKAVMEQIDASLKRLGTDYIDLYQIHRFDPNAPVEETMEALHDVVKAGKVRYIGASSMWAWQFSKMQYIAALNGWTRFVSMQHQYNLVQREEEREMFGVLADLGVGSLPWSPLAAGLVTRPWGDKSTTRGANNPTEDRSGRPLFLQSDKPIIDAVEKIAATHGVSMATAAMAWVFNNPLVTSPIIGATRPKHLADAVAALDIKLSPEEVASLEQPYAPRLPTYFD